MMEQKSESKIAKFYSQYPFPNIPLDKKRDIYETLIYKLISGISKKDLNNQGGRNIRILDAGCGTGELSLGLAGGKRSVLGIDSNKKSIEIAKMRAKKFNVDAKFKQFDFVKNNLPDSFFDFIFSIGVLHHTADPEKNFRKLIKSLKKGGYIIIGIYNPYGSLQVRLKRGILNLIAGDNFEKKVELYRKLFYRRELSRAEEVAVADAFANPYRRYYTFEELHQWFKSSNIEYLECVPAVEVSNNFKLIKALFTNIFKKKKIDLMATWQEIVSLDKSVNIWELSPPLNTATQLLWGLIGRGELINLIGRK